MKNLIIILLWKKFDHFFAVQLKPSLSIAATSKIMEKQIILGLIHTFLQLQHVYNEVQLGRLSIHQCNAAENVHLLDFGVHNIFHSCCQFLHTGHNDKRTSNRRRDGEYGNDIPR